LGLGNLEELSVQKGHLMENNSQYYLELLAEQERLKANRFAGVRTVLVVLSSSGMAFDIDGFRGRIHSSYPEAAVFFVTTRGKPLGAAAQGHVDLVIDLTGPGQRQQPLFARSIRSKARFTVGRSVGFFRKRIYDRVFDEKSAESLRQLQSLHPLAREHEVQRRVLALAGVASAPHAESAVDRGKSIALDLPPLARA
jgi:hypothetical protein